MFKHACIGNEQSVKVHDILTKKSEEFTEEFAQNLTEQGFNFHWYADLSRTLSQSVWRRPDLHKEMGYWLDERIQNFP